MRVMTFSLQVFVYLSFIVISTTKITIFEVNFHRLTKFFKCVSVCKFSSFKCYCDFCQRDSQIEMILDRGATQFWVVRPHNPRLYSVCGVPHIITLTLYAVCGSPQNYC